MGIYKNLRSLILAAALAIIISCDFFDSSGISDKEIKTASKWSKNDQPPTYPECESLSIDSQIDCMSDILSSYITEYVYSSNIIAKGDINEEIQLIIKIDKEGFFSLQQLPNVNGGIVVIDPFTNCIIGISKLGACVISRVSGFVIVFELTLEFIVPPVK